MTLHEFCQPRHAEQAKAVAHGSMLVLASVFAGYNALAIYVRQHPAPHLVRNVLLYTLLGVIEWHQVQRHRRDAC